MAIKYFNVKNGLSTGNILLHASNSSVVASTFTGNIVATNSANLGAVGNLIITGGSANYVLSTDGTGNLSWVAQTGGGGTYGNSNVAAYLPTYTGNLTAGNANISGSLVANTITTGTGSGNISGANYVVANYFTGTLTTAAQPNITSVGNLTTLTVTGNVSANYFIGNGSQLTGLPASYSNANVAAYLPTYTGNLTAGNANISGSLVAGTITTGSGTGNISGANYVVANYFSGNGSLLTSITGANVTGYVPLATTANTAGTVTTAAQPNITSLGTLTSLTVSGDSTITGNLTVSGSYQYANVTSFNVKDPIIEQGGNPNGTPLASNDGKDRGQLLHYYSGSAIDAFMGWDNSNAEFSFGSNVSVSNEVVTFNSFGNLRAGYFIGNGATLTNITGANVTGYVPLSTTANTAGTVTTAAQPNITSVGTLTGLTVSGLLVATGTGIKTANIQDTTGTITITTNYSNIAGDVGVYGNLTAGTSGTGNVTASYFVGNGSQLTGISASSSNTANTANTAATVTTNAQPNITSTGTLTSLTVSGNVNLTGANVSLGNVSNIHITGGTANYVLATDGSGSLSWVEQSGGSGLSTITVDNFTGNSVQTVFTLSVSPTSVNNTFVNIDGVFQLRDAYSLSGANITFDSAPVTGASIEVTTTEFLATGQGSFVTRNYTGNGVQNTFTVTSGVTASSVLVAENGILQVPTTDYTVSGANLTFTSAPANAVAIQVRELAVAVASSGASSLTWNIASSNATMSASNGYFVDTSGGAKTMTLPSSATLGDTIRINDLAGSFSTNNLTVARNGHKIQGIADNLLVDVDQSSFGLVYSNSTYGWKVLEL